MSFVPRILYTRLFVNTIIKLAPRSFLPFSFLLSAYEIVAVAFVFLSHFLSASETKLDSFCLIGE